MPDSFALRHIASLGHPQRRPCSRQDQAGVLALAPGHQHKPAPVARSPHCGRGARVRPLHCQNQVITMRSPPLSPTQRPAQPATGLGPPAEGAAHPAAGTSTRLDNPLPLGARATGAARPAGRARVELSPPARATPFQASTPTASALPTTVAVPTPTPVQTPAHTPTNTPIHTPAQQAAREPALARLYQGALARLPALASQPDANLAIATVAEQLLPSFPPGDPRRLDLVRTASYFLDTTAPTLAETRQRLHAAAEGGARPEQARSLDALWGNDTERLEALQRTLPRWLADVQPADVAGVLGRLPQHLIEQGPRLGPQIRHFLETRDPGHIDPARGIAPLLSRGHDWLRSHMHGQGLIDAHLGYVNRGGSNRALPTQLIDMAADLKILSADGPRLVAFARRLLAADDAAQAAGRPPAVSPEDRRELLLTLIRQLPEPAIASPQLQHEVLDLVKHHLQALRMPAEDRAQLIATLLPVIGSLNTSYLPSRDAQAAALRVADDGLAQLPPVHAAPLMQQMLDLCNVRGGPPRPPGPAAPARMIELVLSRLDAGLQIDTPQAAVAPLLPVLHRLLQQACTPGADGKDERLLQPALACLQRGGLPAGMHAAARKDFIDQTLGPDPALHTRVALALMQQADPASGLAPDQRAGAARYLHHLLDHGGHRLDPSHTDQARHIVEQAFTHGHDPEDPRRHRTVAIHSAALLHEMAGTRPPGPQPFDKLTEMLTQQALLGLDQLSAQQAVWITAPLVAKYGHMTPPMANATTQVLARYLGPELSRDSPDRGPGTERQTVALSLIVNLSCSTAADDWHVQKLATTAWRRMAPTNQKAALNQLFDGFETALPTGQRAVIDFVKRLRNPEDFVSAAGHMASSIWPSQSIDPGIRQQAVQVIEQRLPALPYEHISTLVRDSMAHAEVLPQPLWEAIDRQLLKLDDISLRSLVTAWGNRTAAPVPGLPPPHPDARAPAPPWQEARTRLSKEVAALAQCLSDPASIPDHVLRKMYPASDPQDPALRARALPALQARHARLSRHLDTVEAFMRLATEAAAPAGLLPPPRPLPPAVAEEVVAALPQMDPPLMQAALRHLHDAPLPEATRRELTHSLLSQYGRLNAPAREATLGVGLRGDPAATLQMLAGRIGTPQWSDAPPSTRGGRTIVRPSINERLTLPGGRTTTLKDELLRRPAPEVQPALETLAESAARPMPPEHLNAIADLLCQRLPSLPDDARLHIESIAARAGLGLGRPATPPGPG